MGTYTSYRQASAKLIHPYYEGTATSGSSLSTIEDATWPIKQNVDAGDLYVDQFILRPNAATPTDRTRSVQAYTPASGYLSVTDPYALNPYLNGVGEAYELHGIIEPEPTLLRLINEALKRTLIVVEFTVPCVALQNRHKINTVQTWLNEPKYVRQVGFLTVGESRNQIDPYQRVVRHDSTKLGTDVFIEHPGLYFDPSSTFYVKALKPAYYHCRANGGTFGDLNGVTAETDEAVPQDDWVAAGVRLLAWEQFNIYLSPGDKDRAEKEQQLAAAIFSDLSMKYLDVPQYSGPPTEIWGPTPTYSGWH